METQYKKFEINNEYNKIKQISLINKKYKLYISIGNFYKQVIIRLKGR